MMTRQDLIQRAYDSQGYKGTDYLVESDRYAALEKMSDEELKRKLSNHHTMDANNQVHPILVELFSNFNNLFSNLDDLKTQRIDYRGWVIEPEKDAWALKYNMNFRYYKEGDERIRSASTIDEAKDAIWEKIMTSIPQHKVVMNKRVYYFFWIEDAIKFAVMFEAEEFIPGVTA